MGSPLKNGGGDTPSSAQEILTIRTADIIAFKTDPRYQNIVLCALSFCPKTPSICCGRCQSSFYCCEDHREQHWRIEGHNTSCKASKPYDPENDPLPGMCFRDYLNRNSGLGTVGNAAKAPADFWDPSKKSFCFGLSKIFDVMPPNYYGEHKLFLLKFQYPSNPSIDRMLPITICDKVLSI